MKRKLRYRLKKTVLWLLTLAMILALLPDPVFAGAVGTYSVGTNPTGIAVDSGGNVWVTNSGSSNVTKLKPDGTPVGTYSVDSGPTSIAIDSSGNAWLTNMNSQKVTKLDPDGNILKTYDIGLFTDPNGIAIGSDGYVWVLKSKSSKVVKLKPDDGTQITSSNVGLNPTSIAIDSDKNVWVVNGGTADVSGSFSVTKIGPDGTIIGTYGVGVGPRGIAIDSSGNAWVTNGGSNTVTKLSSSGTTVGTYSAGVDPTGIAVDSYGNVWVSNYSSNTVTELSSSGLIIGKYGAGAGPDGIAVDSGGNVWVANYGGNNVTKIAPASVAVGNVSVTGTEYLPITATDVTLTVTTDSLKAISAGTILSGWFTNLPAGLTATAKAAVADGSKMVTITISGTPTAVSNAPMAITIPADAINNGDALSVIPGPGAGFDIAGPSATVENVTVSGNKNSPITSTDVTINVANDSFAAITGGTDLTSWFTNLPSGLSAAAITTVSAGSQTVTISISGTPKSGLSAAIAITIPAAGMASGHALPVASNASAKFNIIAPLYSVGYAPCGIAIDSSGNAWVVNTGDTVTKLSPSGETIGTYLLDFNSFPSSIAIDSAGNVWVTKSKKDTVTKFSPSWAPIYTYYDGTTSPRDIAIDSYGNVWVAYASGTVIKLTPSGNDNLVYDYDDGLSPLLSGIAVDPSGNAWVANTGSNTVTKLPSGINYSVGMAPTAVAVDSGGNVWVTNSNDNTVTELSPTGSAIGTYSVGSNPQAIAVDPSGNVWVANVGGNTVTELSLTGVLIRTYSVGSAPSAITFGSDGYVWVTNRTDENVTRFAPAPSAAVGNVVVTGTQYSPITATDVTVAVSYDSLKAITGGADLSGWFSNLPAGLTATAKTAVAAGSKTVTITIEGTPTAISNEAMAITVPAPSMTGDQAIPVTSNAGARFAISAPAPSATVGNTTVTGNEYSPVAATDVTVTVAYDSLKAISGAADLSGWFLNLPVGLTATAKAAVTDGSKTVTITIGGAPTAALSAPMAITIPAAGMTSGHALPVTSNASACFDIIAPSAAVGDVTVTGSKYMPITTKDVTITVNNGSLAAIAGETDLSGWFLNLPAGLTATAKAAVTDGSHTVTISIGGTPTVTSTTPMAITIPAAGMTSGRALPVTSNTNASFDIKAPSATVGDMNVTGSQYSPITDTDLTVTVNNGSLAAIAGGADLSGWFLNLPAGLTAKAKTAVTAGSQTVTITIGGTPTATLSAPMEIAIPAAGMTSGLSQTVTLNANAGFDIKAPSATVGDVTVTGSQYSPITAADVIISVANDSLAAITGGTDLSSWFTNLPAGLTATAKAAVTAGSQTVTITFGGTPTAALSTAMTITIPAAGMTSGHALPVTSNANAGFNISAPSATVGNVTVTGTHYAQKTDTDVTVTMINDSIKAISAGADLSGWITNLPAGLTAKAKSAVTAGATSVIISIGGTPTDVSKAPMAITIPAAGMTSGHALPVTYNDNARFAITDPAYGVGSYPQGLAIDSGGNVWVANMSDSTVTKLSSTGFAIGTYPVGISPVAIAVDPSGNVWVANRGTSDNSGGSVTKLTAGGTLIGTPYPVGKGPAAIAIDSGGNVWVANSYYSFNIGSTVTKLSSTGSAIGTYPVGKGPLAIAIDSGGNVWTANSGSHDVTKLSSTGSAIGTYPSGGDSPYGIAVDSGGKVWVANQGTSTVTVLEWDEKNTAYKTTNTLHLGQNPRGITIDSAGNVWVTTYGDGKVTKLSSTGTAICTYDAGSSGYIAVDSAGNAWVTNDNNKTVTKILTATPAPPAFVPVTGISGVPPTATAGTPLMLTGTVAPGNATNHTIAWSVQDAGTTGATISGITLSAAAAGTATVRATITNGLTETTDYTQDFNITVNPAQVTDATISPGNRSFDKHTPADVQTTVTWGSATGVTNVRVGGSSIGAGSYSVSGDTLTIKKEYLAAQATGSLPLTVAFNAGAAVTLTVAVTDTTPPTLSPASRNYDLNAPADVTTAITWNSAASVTNMVYRVSPDTTPFTLDTGDYTVLSNNLTIKNSFFSGLSLTSGAAINFVITFNSSASATLKVDVVNGYTPSSNADLGSLSVNGTPVSGFDPNDADYDVVLPNGTSSATVAATASDAHANVSITPASTLPVSSLPGTVTVTVTAEDGIATKTYTINLTVAAPATTYTVTFNSDGSVYTTKTVNAGDSIGSAAWPADPARSSYTFGGWFTGENGSGTKFTSTTTVNAATTVYAKWTYSGGGGGGGGGTTPPPNNPPNTEKSGDSIIATTNAPATSDSNGNATASVTKDQLSAAVSSAVAEAKKQGEGTAAVVEIKVDAPSNTSTVETAISKDAVGLAANGGADALKISTPVASISFDADALAGINKEASADVKITTAKVDAATLTDVAKELVGDRPVFNFSVTSGNETISQFGGNVTVAVPYTPKAGEDTNAIVVYYINKEGKPEAVPDCKYDPVTKTVIFTTNHFSEYAVGYNKVSFSDVKDGAWYKSAVDFAAARGIVTGTGNGNYSPDGKLTRAQLLVMLMRAYGIAPDTDLSGNFSDAGSTYYTGYLAAAKRLGITEGLGNNLYAPEKQITRQEMFTLLYNTLKVIGQLPESSGKAGNATAGYSDADSVASWAKDAAGTLADAGIVGGSNGKLSPKNTTTRAEMAQVLYNLLSK